MKKILVQTVLVVVLTAGAAGTWRFATLILHEYEHAHEVVLTLKIGAYPDSAGVLEADRQGRLEAYAQLGAYSVSLALLIGSVLGLKGSFRNRPRRGPKV